MSEQKDKNYTYIVECSDGTLYTGWTNDIEKRLKAVKEGKGAEYTRLPETGKTGLFRGIRYETAGNEQRSEDQAVEQTGKREADRQQQEQVRKEIYGNNQI